MSRRNRDTWSRSTTSWYRKGWTLLASGDNMVPEGYTGYGFEREEDKEKEKEKSLNITKEDLWALQ